MQQTASEGPIPPVRTEEPERAGELAFALLDALWCAPIGLAVLDRELRFVEVNDAIARATGLSPAEHAGRTLAELFGARPEPFPRTIADLDEAMRRVLASGRPGTHSAVTWVLPDGRTRQWACSFYPVVGPGRAVRGVCALLSDATDECEHEAAVDRARARAELSAARLALLHDVTAELSAALAAEEVGEIVVERLHRSLGACAVTVRRAEDGRLRLVAERGLGGADTARQDVPLGADLPDAVAARDGRSLWLETRDAIATRFPTLAELVRDRGHAAWVLVPLAARGAVLGTLGLAFDRARAFDLEERALVLAVAEQCAQAFDRISLFDRERAARAEAERTRALLDAVVENAPIGLAFVDRDLRFARVNPVLAEMNGLPPEAHLGRTTRELLPGLPTDATEQAWRDILATGRAILDVEVSGETPAAPGRRRTWLESWYPVRTGDEILGIGSVVREVTAEREAEEFQRNVLGVVGHDLRTPLAALVLSARMLAGAQDPSPERARVAARIFSTAHRMERIISVLLDYARLRAGQGMPLRPCRCDVARIVEAAADEGEASHPGRTVRRSGEGDGAVEWDPDRIAQALANLVGNALDYSPVDGPVDIAWRGDERAVTIDVSNRGPPIPEAVLPRLFEPFRRAERERPGGRDGLGLGLFIARAVAIAHGGEIEARSGEGEPTVFTLRLPRSAT